MKIQVNQKPILKAAVISSNIADEKISSNIGSFYISAKSNNQIELIASNSYALLYQALEATIFSEGAILVEANIFVNIIKSLRDKVINIYEKDKMIYLESDAKFRLNRLSDEAFNLSFFKNLFSKTSLSKLVSHSSSLIDDDLNENINIIDQDLQRSTSENLIFLTKSEIISLFKFTKFAVSNQESRVTLSCLALTITPEQISSYAMDGHRLSRYQIKTQNNISAELLLPSRLVEQVISIVNNFAIETIIIESTDQKIIHFMFLTKSELKPELKSDIALDSELISSAAFASKPKMSLRDVTHMSERESPMILISKLVNAEFLNYEKIIPSLDDYKTTLEVDAAILSESIASVTSISNEKFKALKVSILDNNTIQITTSGQNGSLGTKLLNCDLIEYNSNQNEYSDEAKASKIMVFGVNYRYLLDVLDVIKNDIAILILKNSTSPIVIKSKSNPEALFLIMPIKI